MASLHDILAPEPAPTPKQESQPPPTQSATPSQPEKLGESLSSTVTYPYPSFQSDVKTEASSSGPTSTPGQVAALAAALGSAAANSKMRHLKKEDGIPLWRKDIQYDFLRLVFFNKTRCFRKYSTVTEPRFTFAEIYIEAMANSSKCSKILKEKLLTDGEGAISVAMVCLLVNLGRMNTTLNFFPEMRAQLRTYHSIPALQAHQDPNAYKQLQDAPRLKSILKGATEDEPQPGTLEAIREARKPRTNVVNLIFVLSQFAPKISDLHFTAPCDFHDLVMRPTLSSESRARAFLWLIWWYLESDYTAADAVDNPFGPGLYAETDVSKTGIPLKVPALASLTEQQADLENVDTEDEVLFGEVKRKERIAILASDPSPAMIAMKRARKDKPLLNDMRSEDEGSDAGWWKPGGQKSFENDGFQTRSPSPAGRPSGVGTTPDARARAMPHWDEKPPGMPVPVKKGPGRGNWRRNKPKPEPTMPVLSRTLTSEGTHGVPLLPNTNNGMSDSVGPATPASGLYAAYTSFPINSISPDHAAGFDHVPTPSYQAQKRGRGVTQHQSALMNHRRAQMEYLLDRSIKKLQATARQRRHGTATLIRAMDRLARLQPGYDSEEEYIRAKKARERDRDEDNKGGSRVHAKDADDGSENIIKRPRVYLGGYAEISVRDVGEEAISLAQSLRRARRRLRRWQDGAPGDSMIRREKHEKLRAQNGPNTGPKDTIMYDEEDADDLM